MTGQEAATVVVSHAPPPTRKRLHDEPLPNDENALREVLGKLQTRGRVLVIIDQPASIGALVIAVARVMQIDVAYLPGLAMRRIADLHPGEGKTDARDSFIIADTARTMPHTLPRIGTDDETVADLTVLAGYDDDLASQSTRLSNRLSPPGRDVWRPDPVATADRRYRFCCSHRVTDQSGWHRARGRSGSHQ